MKKLLSSAAMLAGFLTLNVVALSQTEAAAQAQPDFVTQQPADEWLSSYFIGQKVTNAAGETIGDINDLLFDRKGTITAAVLGVGGFLGMAEKNVAVPFSSLTFGKDKDGNRIVTATPLTKETLQKAPDFKAIEKSLFMKAMKSAGEMGEKAMEKAGELKDKATDASLAASQFEGVWKVKDTAGKPFEITLSKDGSAKAERSDEGMTGTWKEDGGAAVITWNTGWTTKIVKDGDTYKKTAYGKGKPLSGSPDNSSEAQKAQ